jgi:two-component system, sensor histidine kinase ChiS
VPKFCAILNIVLIVFIFAGDLSARQMEKRFHQITIEDGLSQSTVMAILQDSRGYMWFGTHDGLNRYDGYNFATYRFDPENPHSISDDDIRVIYEDRRGDLWIGTQRRGLNRYDRERDRFTRYIGEAEEWETLSSNTIWSILEDSYGIFWVGTGYGLNILDRDDETFHQIFHEPDDPKSLSNNQITVLYEDKSGDVWIGTANGLNRFDRDEEAFEQMEQINVEGSLITLGTIRSVYEDDSGRFWIGTENQGLFRADRDKENFTQFRHQPENSASISGDSVFEILEDSKGQLWIGTGSHGLNIFDREREEFHRYYHQPENPNSLSNNSINSLYESRENIIWAGTFAGGISFYEMRPEVFRQFRNEPENPFSLSNNVVQTIFQDRNENIWIGTDGGGLNLFEPAESKFQHFNSERNNLNSLSADVVLDIHETEQGLWLATYGGGIDLYDQEEETFTNFRHDSDNPESLSSDYVFDIHETRDGYLWFSTNWGGVSVLEPGTEHFKRFMVNTDNPGGETSLSNNDVRVVYEDQFGDIWIGAYGGLVDRYNREEDRFTQYNLNEQSFYYASIAQTFLEDSENRLLTGTRGAGLLRFDRETKQFVPVLTTRQGLPSNTIHSIVEGDSGNLWLSTNNGLVRYHPVSGEVRAYSEQHGLQGREFNPGAAMKDTDGFIYFGGVNGFVRFHPDSLRTNTETPPVVLTELLIYNEPVAPGDDSVLEKQFSETDKLVLPHHTSVITLGYSALEYSLLKGNEFAYKLEGFDENWNNVGSQRRATYTNLNPGEYRFMVRASNNDGIWGEPTVLSVSITPPFWRTAWFIGVMALLVTAMIIVTHRFRVQHIRKRNVDLELMVRERTQELRESNQTKNKLFAVVAHDLRNIASGIVGWSTLLKESADEGRHNEVKEYVVYLHQASAQFSSFLKNFLDWARSQTTSLQTRPEQLNAAKLIEEVIAQEESITVKKGIRIIQDTDPELRVWADSDMLSVVLRNLLQNAVKFTETGGKIEIITTAKNEDEITIAICDSGVGMDTETVNKLMSSDAYISKPGTSGEKGTGLGFTLCKDFVQKNNGSLHIESKPGNGTKVYITIPAAKLTDYSVVQS